MQFIKPNKQLEIIKQNIDAIIPEDELIKANVNLGSNYPKPIIDLKDSRHKALESFSGL